VSDAAPPLRRLVRELRRRRVFRTAAYYIIGTWLLLQFADVVFPALDLSERAIRYILIAAMLGFPAVLVFGWFYDVGAHGIRRTTAAGADELASAQPLGRRDFLLLTALALVAAAILYNVAGMVVDEPVEGSVPEAVPDGPPIVAVLPFTTTSRDGDSDFFAAGVHDDLLTQLSQLQSLRVISRTSVLEYKDTVRNIREIGRELGADAVLEGGVQRVGDRIRINAQLIDARSDEHLWAQTYDRALTPANIFDVQTEIARAISASLHTTLSEQEDADLAIIPTENMAAYRAYRRAMEMAEKQSVYKNKEYRAALEEAVTLDPEFTRAWAELGGHLSYINFWGERNLEEIRRAEEILELLRKLAPNSVDHLMAQAYYSFYTLKDYDQAFEIITLAEQKAPSDLKILEMKLWILRRQGRLEERTAVFRQITQLDPRNTTTATALVFNLMTLHKYEEASRELEDARVDSFKMSYMRSLSQLREHRDYDRFTAELALLGEEYDTEVRGSDLWEAEIWARNYAAAEQLFDELRREETERYSDYPGVGPWRAGKMITYMFLGEDSLLEEAIRETRAHLEQSRTAEQAENTPSLYSDLALVAALEGDGEETARLTRKWRRGVAESGDATELLMGLEFACRGLGIAGAAAEAVDCIREALAQPSTVHAFLEPLLPFYDSIRDTPEFQVLLSELD
jgi:TolB-like protein